MRGHFVILFLSLSLFISAAVGASSLSHEVFKQMVFSSVNKTIIPSNANSCYDLENDIDRNCNLNYGASCSQAQDYVNCAVRQVRKDCGNDQVDDFCDGFNSQIANSNIPCKSLTCSANSLFISGSIVGILIYKMIFEKFVVSL